MIVVVIIIIIVVIIIINNNKDKNETNERVLTVTSYNDDELETEDDGWEIVHKKTSRWNELGYGHGNNFPGYGKLYKRFFEVWYCEVGSKEKKGLTEHEDTYPMNYSPKNYIKITKVDIDLNSLQNTLGYEALYSGLDNKNKKRWYFAVQKSEPTGIYTKREIETDIQNNDINDEEEIDYSLLYPDYEDLNPKSINSYKKRYIVTVYIRETGEKQWNELETHKVLEYGHWSVMSRLWHKNYCGRGSIQEKDKKESECFVGIGRDTKERKNYKFFVNHVQS